MSINTEGVSSSVASFIKDFYRLSDDGSAHEGYTKSFAYSANDFLFQIGPMKPAKSSDEILEWRRKGWEHIATRKHTVYNVFSKAQGDDGKEYMLYGLVEYVKKDGDKAAASWGGRMVFDSSSLEKGDPKLAYYKVWIVSQSYWIEDLFVLILIFSPLSFFNRHLYEMRLST